MTEITWILLAAGCVAAAAAFGELVDWLIRRHGTEPFRGWASDVWRRRPGTGPGGRHRP